MNHPVGNNGGVQEPSSILSLLIIDDDETDRESIVRLLNKSDSNIKCFEVSEYKNSSQIIANESIDCILLDYKLSGVEADTILSDLKKTKHGLTPIPVIILTGMKDEKLGLKIIQSGAQDCLMKGLFDSTLLLRSIRYSIERHRLSSELETLRQEQYRRLESSLQQQAKLMSWDTQTTVSTDMVGLGALSKRYPLVFEDLIKQYDKLLEEYISAMVYRESPSRSSIRSLANMIGDYGCGPRDVMDIHVKVIRSKSIGEHIKKAHAYSYEGRLLALEIMGNLVDYYRLRKSIIAE